MSPSKLPIDVDGSTPSHGGSKSIRSFLRLVRWDRNAARFVTPTPVRETFEYYWRATVDPVFGRVICWINFSSGAEFLAKGVCLLYGIDFRTQKPRPAYPTHGTNLSEWAQRVSNEPLSAGKLMATDFGTLGSMYRTNGTLHKLFEKVPASVEDQQLLIAGYCLLAQTIRNRDAHAYVPNVRDYHHGTVADVFVQCFNLLVFLASWWCINTKRMAR